MGTASLVAITTTLAAASGGLTCSIAGRLLDGKWNIGLACNGVLAGLVSITAPCSVIAPGFSIIIGFIGALVYFGFSRLMLRIKIDDPLDAAAVHGACGFWGCIAVAIFSTEEYMLKAAYDRESAQDFGTRLGNQLVVALTITVWTIGLSGLMFFVAKKIIGIRTEDGASAGGLDAKDFGMKAYEKEVEMMQASEKEVEILREDSAQQTVDNGINM